MNYIYVGKIVNTHALKGEVRIISNFEFKDKVFKKDKALYIGDLKNKEIIESYRIHKNFDMIKFIGIDYINDVLKYKGKKVYVLKEEMSLKDDEYLDVDLINLNALFNDKEIGKVKDIINNNGYKLFLVGDKYIPYNKDFIQKISLKENVIIFKNIEELL